MIYRLFLIILLSSACLTGTDASFYVLENEQDTLIGELKTIESDYEDTLLDIARANSLGYHDIKLANPAIDTWLPGAGKNIQLPAQFVLPHAPRDGIILNIPEMRLYYFPKRKPGRLAEVYTFPLGIGREGWQTPYVDTRIIQKQKNPYWFPPESIRLEHAENGDSLPKRVGPGPDNPLGQYALRLGLPQYLIHGTNKPYGIGMRVSHGCIRLYPEDIEFLYSRVSLQTPVHIINQPYKLGLSQGKLYLEAHPFLQEDAEQFEDNITSVVKILVKLTGEQSYLIDWELAKLVIRERLGIPVEIGRITSPVVQTDLGTDTEIINGIDLKLEMALEE